MMYLCQMINGYSDEFCNVIVNVIFSEICKSKEEGMKKFYDDYETDGLELEHCWSCENCYNDNGKDCLEKNCDKVEGYGEETFKHTHTKECLCPYERGTYYYRYDEDDDIKDLKAIQEYIESGDSYNFLRAFIGNLENNERGNSVYEWVCTKI